MTLTDSAAERIKAVLAQRSTPALGLRIGVRARGCSGLTYTMDYAEQAGPNDERVEDKGVTLLIDPAATMFLIGTELDYVDDTLQAHFVFRNPNEKSRCGCGESFSV
jgi:iron-sulfur cluster assembly protein